jgi:hypothetical protein
MKHPKIGDILISSDVNTGFESVVGLVLSDPEQDSDDRGADWFKVMVPGGQIRDFFIPKRKRRKAKVKDESTAATR